MPEMGVETNEAGSGQKVAGPSESAQTSMGARQPNPGAAGGKKRLDTEAGDQRVKWQDGFGTSRISQAPRVRAFKNRRSENIDGYRRDRGFDPVIGWILYQTQNTVAELAGTGIGSGERAASTVRRGMFARCTMTMSHDVHSARMLHPHAHTLTLRPAKLSGHLPCYEQE
jgi:hypothetical protein